jgi:hypothetical protein
MRKGIVQSVLNVTTRQANFAAQTMHLFLYKVIMNQKNTRRSHHPTEIQTWCLIFDRQETECYNSKSHHNRRSSSHHVVTHDHNSRVSSSWWVPSNEGQVCQLRIDVAVSGISSCNIYNLSDTNYTTHSASYQSRLRIIFITNKMTA